MAGKDCNCGETRVHEVPNPDADAPVDFAPVDVTASWTAALARARELLHFGAGEGTAKTLVDSLCTALTICREQKQVLATEVDKLESQLENCQDELSDAYDGESAEDDWDEDTEVNQGVDNDGIQATTNISTKTLPQALSERARSTEQVRQDNVGEHAGRGPRGRVRDEPVSRLLTSNVVPAAVPRVRQYRPGGVHFPRRDPIGPAPRRDR
jgi:hypothetical protein